MSSSRNKIIVPQWMVSSRVKACSTLRFGPNEKGHSRKPYDRFNLAMHVEDEDEAVLANRVMLKESLKLPSEPVWLQQTHGNRVVEAGSSGQQIIQADASYTRERGIVCAVLTADCLPVLLCDKQGTVVAAVHAGWRGLLNGVLQNTLDAIDRPGRDVLAWLGPAIGPESFEVGDDVRDKFVDADEKHSEAFLQQPGGKWLANIYKLAALQLFEAGVSEISGGKWCTCLNHENFFSFRRDGKTGRMASLIWIS